VLALALRAGRRRQGGRQQGGEQQGKQQGSGKHLVRGEGTDRHRGSPQRAAGLRHLLLGV